MKKETKIETEHARKYLIQMCKHFAHKVTSNFEENEDGVATGVTKFEMGDCEYEAKDGILKMTAIAEDEKACDRIAQVVDAHLVRFAHRENLEYDWN